MRDMLGNRIRVGDTIAYPAVEGTLTMKLAKITEISEDPPFVRITTKRRLTKALPRCIVVTGLMSDG